MLTQIFSYYKDEIKYGPITRRFEYAPEADPIWEKASSWIEIRLIHVAHTNQGHGTTLLARFIESLEPGTGVMLNAVPLPGCTMSNTELQTWYIKRGFKQINKTNISLYFIKE